MLSNGSIFWQLSLKYSVWSVSWNSQPPAVLCTVAALDLGWKIQYSPYKASQSVPQIDWSNWIMIVKPTIIIQSEKCLHFLGNGRSDRDAFKGLSVFFHPKSNATTWVSTSYGCRNKSALHAWLQVRYRVQQGVWSSKLLTKHSISVMGVRI